MGPFGRANVVGLAAVALATSCGYDEGKDLPAIVERATPGGARVVGSCGGSSGLIESPSHGCTFFVTGEPAEVTVAVAIALVKQGFDVSCRGAPQAAEITGLRGNVRATGKVTDNGAAVVSATDSSAVNVYPAGYVPEGGKPIPAGQVALRLDASRQSEASVASYRSWVANGVPCTRDGLRRQTLDECVDQWNAPANGANRRLAASRARVPEADVLLRRSNEPGVSTGCFFGFLAPRGRYLILKGAWQGDRLAWEEPELGYAKKKDVDPEAELRPDGTLVLLQRD
jgi:hypothetical protein